MASIIHMIVNMPDINRQEGRAEGRQAGQQFSLTLSVEKKKKNHECEEYVCDMRNCNEIGIDARECGAGGSFSDVALDVVQSFLR